MGGKDIVREFTVCSNHVTAHVPTHCAGEAHPDADEGRFGEASPALPDSLPVVYLHVHDGDGSEVLRLCRELGCRDFVLAAIRPRCWNDDLTPWECPGLFADDAPFAGKAAEQLRIIGHIHRRRTAQLSAFFNIAENILRHNFHPVLQGLVIHHHIQRRQGDTVLFQQCIR